MMRLCPSSRPLIYDATHLALRLRRQATTGIDQIDVHYAQALSAAGRIACAAHYGWRAPHFFSPDRFAQLSRMADAQAGDAMAWDDDPVWRAFSRWLLGAGDMQKQQWPAGRPDALYQRLFALSDGQSKETPRISAGAQSRLQWSSRLTIGHTRGPLVLRRFSAGLGGLIQQTRFHLAHDIPNAPENALYLNVAQAGLEYPRFFRWLDRRPDIVPVFMVHDLLPLDYPQFFRPGYKTLFERRLATIMSHAQGAIVASHSVRERLEAAYRRQERAPPPILTQPFPSPLGASALQADSVLAQVDYFVMIGTLEPRKNHAMILDVWRAMGSDAPKLALVGGVGASGADCLAAIASSPDLQASVRPVSGLSHQALAQLIAHARGVLVPSFAEGYGLPVVEALSLGTTVIASDLPVFREVAQNCAIFLDPNDRQAWSAAIARLRGEDMAQRRGRTEAFLAPQWPGYFEAVLAFLDRFSPQTGRSR